MVITHFDHAAHPIYSAPSSFLVGPAHLSGLLVVPPIELLAACETYFMSFKWLLSDVTEVYTARMYEFRRKMSGVIMQVVRECGCG